MLNVCKKGMRIPKGNDPVLIRTERIENITTITLKKECNIFRFYISICLSIRYFDLYIVLKTV